MASNSLYSPAQWDWIAERYKDGYTMKKLGDFLEVQTNTVGVQLAKRGIKCGDRTKRFVGVPLIARKDEFNALWNKESLYES